MKNELAVILIQKGIINNSTKLKSQYKGRDLGMDEKPLVDYFSISNVKELKGNIYFHAYRNDGFQTVIKACDVLEIDGMDPQTFAGAYDLKEDGTHRRIGAKRGRKSNHERQRRQQSDSTSNQAIA